MGIEVTCYYPNLHENVLEQEAHDRKDQAEKNSPPDIHDRKPANYGTCQKHKKTIQDEYEEP